MSRPIETLRTKIDIHSEKKSACRMPHVAQSQVRPPILLRRRVRWPSRNYPKFPGMHCKRLYHHLHYAEIFPEYTVH